MQNRSKEPEAEGEGEEEGIRAGMGGARKGRGTGGGLIPAEISPRLSWGAEVQVGECWKLRIQFPGARWGSQSCLPLLPRESGKCLAFPALRQRQLRSCPPQDRDADLWRAGRSWVPVAEPFGWAAIWEPGPGSGASTHFPLGPWPSTPRSRAPSRAWATRPQVRAAPSRPDPRPRAVGALGPTPPDSPSSPEAAFCLHHSASPSLFFLSRLRKTFIRVP